LLSLSMSTILESLKWLPVTNEIPHTIE
jgi:hypothetical protein